MGQGFAEAPLALFTTLAPMGACAFIALLIAQMKGAFAEGGSTRINRAVWLPLVVVLVGFCGAASHTLTPAHGIYAFTGLGRSPLTNEIAVGGLFVVVALVFCVLSARGKMGDGARRGWLVALSVLAVAFSAFCGLAYMVETIPSWDTPFTIVQMLGYGLLGGSALGLLTLEVAHTPSLEGLARPLGVVAAIGFVLALVGFGGQIELCQTISNVWGTAASLVPAIWGLFAVLAVCAIAGVVFGAMALKRGSVALAIVACVVVAVGVFFARIGFYGLQMSIAL